MTTPDAWEPPPNDANWRGAEHLQPNPLVEQAAYDEAERLRAIEEVMGQATCETEDEDSEC